MYAFLLWKTCQFNFNVEMWPKEYAAAALCLHALLGDCCHLAFITKLSTSWQSYKGTN